MKIVIDCDSRFTLLLDRERGMHEPFTGICCFGDSTMDQIRPRNDRQQLRPAISEVIRALERFVGGA